MRWNHGEELEELPGTSSLERRLAGLPTNGEENRGLFATLSRNEPHETEVYIQRLNIYRIRGVKNILQLSVSDTDYVPRCSKGITV